MFSDSQDPHDHYMTTQDENAGMSTCPICERTWLVTMLDDCLVPACGHYGNDVTAANPARPCHSCGLAHAWDCVRPGLVATEDQP